LNNTRLSNEKGIFPQLSRNPYSDPKIKAFKLDPPSIKHYLINSHHKKISQNYIPRRQKKVLVFLKGKTSKKRVDFKRANSVSSRQGPNWLLFFCCAVDLTGKWIIAGDNIDFDFWLESQNAMTNGPVTDVLQRKHIAHDTSLMFLLFNDFYLLPSTKTTERVMLRNDW